MNDNLNGKTGGGLGFGKSMIYTSGQFGGNILNVVYAGWVLYFYTNDAGGRKPLTTMAIMTALIIGGRIVDALADPLIGYWSDRTNTRIGRRRPFILIGTPFLLISFILLFNPPFPAGSAALIASTFITMGFFWFFFTAVMGPYLSLIPELASSSAERVRLTTFLAIAMLVANAYQGMIVPKMVDQKAWNWGYSNMAFFSAAMSFFFLYITGLFIREKPRTAAASPQPEQKEKYSFTEAFLWTLKNRAFTCYILASVLQYIGFASLMGSVPFIVTRLMGKPESYVTTVYIFSLPSIVVSFFIINFLAPRTGKVRLYQICLFLLAFFLPFLFFIGRVQLPVTEATAGLILIALLGFPITGNMVLPMAILADIVDYDEKVTGLRREAMYFGMQGFLQKAATAMSQGLQGILFAVFGYSVTNHLGINLLGPVAGLSGLIGFLIFLKYPLDEKTKDLKAKA